jgi:hypothetical protein
MKIFISDLWIQFKHCDDHEDENGYGFVKQKDTQT